MALPRGWRNGMMPFERRTFVRKQVKNPVNSGKINVSLSKTVSKRVWAILAEDRLQKKSILECFTNREQGREPMQSRWKRRTLERCSFPAMILRKTFFKGIRLRTCLRFKLLGEAVLKWTVTTHRSYVMVTQKFSRSSDWNKLSC